MEVPKSVQNAIRRANEAHEGAYGTPEEVAAAAEAAPQGKQQEAEPAPIQEPPVGTPENQPEPTKAKDPDPDEERKNNVAYWRHRFEVMRGKYNSEVERFKSTLADKDEAIARLEAKVAEAQQASASKLDVDQLNDLTPEEIEEYGPEMVEFVKKVMRANGQQSADVDALQAKIERLEGQLNERAEREEIDGKARFITKLKAAHPNVAEINRDPAFHAFLAGTDPNTGNPRQRTLAAAERDFDAATVIELIDEFQAQLQAQSSQPAKQIPEELVEPPRATGAGEPVREAPRRQWTGPEISQFYKDVATGRYTAEQKAELEAEIFAARQSA